MFLVSCEKKTRFPVYNGNQEENIFGCSFSPSGQQQVRLA